MVTQLVLTLWEQVITGYLYDFIETIFVTKFTFGYILILTKITHGANWYTE